MLFLGDGDTDIPAMKMVRQKGGQAVAVFDPTKFEPRKSQGQRLLNTTPGMRSIPRCGTVSGVDGIGRRGIRLRASCQCLRAGRRLPAD